MLNGLFFLFANTWKGLKSLYLPPNPSPLAEAQNELDRLKAKLLLLEAENKKLKTTDCEHRESRHHQTQEIGDLKTLIASYKRRLEENESLVGQYKRRQEESELLVNKYRLCLEEHKPFLDLIGNGLGGLKSRPNLDYARTLDYILESATRDVRVLTFKLLDVTLQAEDKIYVCGGHELLGNWVPSSGLELIAVGTHHEVSIGVNELARSEMRNIRYKYALWRKNGWYWESGSDRCREDPVASAIVDTQPQSWEANPYLSATQ
ncbi:hypothetical protein K493DRAFT_315712 [Basidiobolus meristosporus CBS 931.73]|uniref:CBM20 domain-containing protein n=1 Tax=Basidiobolus meristosporus CBS 931.73 TaxID=1314790 RepID=A0A1Y1Y7L9_9FUNG|nr:hypothetical protein K493DRAFT_315712 [Basidiobolus meristosporus CBS 931.73]|eukprot:ORX94012.1 hypothetical protein K493DRAFT_315712 [Basidiobolus meristosporus CBS 931.73]